MTEGGWDRTIDITPYFLEALNVESTLAWSELFGNDRPVELEVGSGKGLFLANSATRNPEVNFVGIELARKYARKAAERVAKQKLGNARVLWADAGRFLSRNTPEASLSAVHVYFPDPWWKARHRKRRVFTNAFVTDIERVLKPDGELHVATDVEEYGGVIRELVAGHPGFREIPPPESGEPSHELDYLTNFERKYRIEGRPIHRASYRLAGRPG